MSLGLGFTVLGLWQELARKDLINASGASGP